MMSMTAVMLISRGRCIAQVPHPNDSAYRSAMYRLRKAGLIAYRREGGRMPVLRLTDEGKNRVAPACRRKAPWPSKWNGIWYQLAFDVPEKHRAYRNVLRAFLKRMRMGCLQKSVWITPRDIRAEYDDLVKAAGVDEFSYLLESRTVLGRSPQDVVRDSWDMERLIAVQERYLNVYKENLNRVLSEKPNRETALRLCREELSAYMAVMEDDPFLPRPLWPAEYLGERTWTFHRDFVRTMYKQM